MNLFNLMVINVALGVFYLDFVVIFSFVSDLSFQLVMCLFNGVGLIVCLYGDFLALRKLRLVEVS